MGKGEIDLVVEGIFKLLNECDKFDKICLKRYELRSKINKLQLTKFETEHGNENYSSTCIYFVYIFSQIKIRRCIWMGLDRVDSVIFQNLIRLCCTNIYYIKI